MATAVRNMTLVQNIHMISNNCVIVAGAQQSTNGLLHQYNSHQYQMGKRPIAPAPEQRSRVAVSIGSNGMMTSDGMRCKKKMALAQIPYGQQQSASVQRRNARERNRVKQVNDGFAKLRQKIPETVIKKTSGGRGASKKLSKVDTLRLAVDYIREMQTILNYNENSPASYFSTSSDNNSLPPYSETSASPTPSDLSDSCSGVGSSSYEPSNIQYAHEQYDSISSASQDDEILEYISWWEQQQPQQ